MSFGTKQYKLVPAKAWSCSFS